MPFVAALMLVALLPVSALVLYVTLGNPNAIRGAVQASERAPMSHDELTTMVDKLAARMKEQPEDSTGWKLLARAYSAMGRYNESVAAFGEASARSPQEDPALLADWADALAMQKQTLQGEPAQLVARALALDPRNQKALSLSASAALERKDYDDRDHRVAQAAGPVRAGQRRSEGDREHDRASRRGEARRCSGGFRCNRRRGSARERNGAVGTGLLAPHRRVSMRRRFACASCSIPSCATALRPAMRCSCLRARSAARGCRSR